MPIYAPRADVEAVHDVEADTYVVNGETVPGPVFRALFTEGEPPPPAPPELPESDAPRLLTRLTLGENL